MILRDFIISGGAHFLVISIPDGLSSEPYHSHSLSLSISISISVQTQTLWVRARMDFVRFFNRVCHGIGDMHDDPRFVVRCHAADYLSDFDTTRNFFVYTCGERCAVLEL